MQIRGFLDTTKQISMSQMDKKGFSLLKGEIYTLLLAYASGCYFLACVVLLRVHLPRRFRIGITVVLGEERDFGFYTWWYEIIFVTGTIVAAVYLWSKKKRRRIELEPMLTKAKFEQEQRIRMTYGNSINDSNHSNSGNDVMILDQYSTDGSLNHSLALTDQIRIPADEAGIAKTVSLEHVISDMSAWWTSSMSRHFFRTKTNTS